MRRSIVWMFVVVLLFSTLPLLAESNDATEKALQGKEQSLWQAWKDHNTKPFTEDVAENSINIAGGAMEKGKQQIVNEVGNTSCTVNSFTLSDFSFVWINKDAVILTYNASQDVTCGGKKQPDKIIASSIWQKKDGKWVSPFHQESTAGM